MEKTLEYPVKTLWRPCEDPVKTLWRPCEDPVKTLWRPCEDPQGSTLAVVRWPNASWNGAGPAETPRQMVRQASWKNPQGYGFIHNSDEVN